MSQMSAEKAEHRRQQKKLWARQHRQKVPKAKAAGKKHKVLLIVLFHEMRIIIFII